jgi:hypothetical protein
MVVDGRRQFVGSNRTAAADAIRDALARPRARTVGEHARRRASIDATVHVHGATPDAVLFVAWADAERTSAPDRGENGGAHLRHVDVVRALEHVALQAGRYDDVVHLTRPRRSPGPSWHGYSAEDGSGDVLCARRVQVSAR